MRNNKDIINDNLIDIEDRFPVYEYSYDEYTVRKDGSDYAYMPQSMGKFDDSTESVHKDVVTKKIVCDNNISESVK